MYENAQNAYTGTAVGYSQAKEDWFNQKLQNSLQQQTQAIGLTAKKSDMKTTSFHVRERSEDILKLLYELDHSLFESTPINAGTTQIKDNPESVEGHLHEAIDKLDNAYSMLNAILVKTGGR